MGVFPEKMCSECCKNYSCGQKKTERLALLYLASGQLPNAANSSNVQTKFAVEHNEAQQCTDQRQIS